MRAWMLVALALCSFGCGRGDGTTREPHGGKQAQGETNGDATACTQLSLTGTIGGFKYERVVTCNEVGGSLLTTIGGRTEIMMRSAGESGLNLLRLKFDQQIPNFLTSGPGQVFIALSGEAAFGNCEATGEFPSAVTVDQSNHGTFDVNDLHYLKADGTCGAALEGTVHGTWTTVPPASTTLN